jgi:pimeloyl-ACP methyl ester carboxylesterase
MTANGLQRDVRPADHMSVRRSDSGAKCKKNGGLNSLKIVEKIPGAWLVQIKYAGHQLPGQYPDKINKIIQTFLSTTGQNS